MNNYIKKLYKITKTTACDGELKDIMFTKKKDPMKVIHVIIGKELGTRIIKSSTFNDEECISDFIAIAEEK